MESIFNLNTPSPVPLGPIFLEEIGFHTLNGPELKSELGIDDLAWKNFQSYWNNLHTDRFMADGGTYRQRRFGVFHYFALNRELTVGAHTSFIQDQKHNSLNGGIARNFEPLEKGLQHNDVLHALILRDISELPLSIQFQDLKIFVHQIRILAGGGIQGQPTPEGIHQDGHLFVAQHLIQRKNIHGGESQVYDLLKRPIFSLTLTHELDTLLVNDPKVFHGVSPITTDEGEGHRDMLLIDFNILN